MSCAFSSAFDSPTGAGAFCVASSPAPSSTRVIRSPRYGITRVASAVLTWLLR